MVVKNSKTLSADIKTSNASLILRLVRENGPVSRADISRMTGLTRATVSALAALLIEHGYLEEIGFNQPGSVGKRATLLDIKTDKIFALAVKFSYHSIYMAKVDLRGRLRDLIKQPLIRESQEQAVRTFLKMAHGMLDKSAAEGEICDGIGLAVPSPVRDGVMFYSSSFHSLEGVNFEAILKKEFGKATYVNNDADAASLAEVWFGGYPMGTNLAFVLMHQGLGCGFMRDNELYSRGVQTSNEFGHTRIESGGPVCFCGKEGCLAAFASDWAIYQRLSQKMKARIEKEVAEDRLSSIEKMMRHIGDHPKTYSTYTEAAARYLGIGLSNLVVMFTPDVIVLEGAMLDIPGFLPIVEETCDANTHPMFKNTCRIARSSLKEDASLVGAGTFYLKDLYADPFRTRQRTGD